jgi:hypothetical protein
MITHYAKAGSHNKGITGNVASSLMRLAVMTSAGLENLKANEWHENISKQTNFMLPYTTIFFFLL